MHRRSMTLLPGTMILSILLHMTACDEPYMKQPLAGGPDTSFTSINATQVMRIQEVLGTEPVAFSFAATSDPHRNYEELRAVLDHMQQDTSIAFVLVCGDITDGGTVNEMKRYVEVMQESRLPFITVIGNKEHAGIGRITFEEMFGARNNQFMVAGSRFVLFDNVVNESDLPLEFDWLRTTLAAPHDGHTIMAMHVQPTDTNQLKREHLEALNEIVAEHRPAHVFMGHNHAFKQREFPDGTPYTTVSWPVLGEYVKVHMGPDTVTRELVRILPPASGDTGP
jgi:3',5'-cyclic-AMP phosphodiesterase